MTRDDIIRMAKEATNKNVLFEFPPQDIKVFERFAELVAAALAQPEREWQGLTDEEINNILEEIMSLLPGAVRLPPGWADTVRAIEAKLKGKNGY
jgi:hypothetical protein